MLKFLWLISAPKDTIKTLSRHVWMFLTKNLHALTLHCPSLHCSPNNVIILTITTLDYTTMSYDAYPRIVAYVVKYAFMSNLFLFSLNW